MALGPPIAAESIPGVEIAATTAVEAPSATRWEKHPTLYPGVDISPWYLLPSRASQAIAVSGGRSSFRHYFCVHKQVQEITRHELSECQLIASRVTPTSVTLTDAMIDHGGVTWHIAIGSRPSMRAQWLPIPAVRSVALQPSSATASTEYEGEIHPKANGLLVTSAGAGAIAVGINGAAPVPVAGRATHWFETLALGANTLTIAVPSGSATTTYTVALERSLLPDEALRAAVVRALEQPTEAELQASDLLALRVLSLPAVGLRDLTGLGAAVNLQSLTLDGNNLTDITELASLQALSRLDLSDNALSNLAPLSGLASLQTLLLRGNSVSDLAPLGALPELRALTLSGNQVSDIGPLAQLATLEELWLDDNAIVDLHPLASLPRLRYLHLGENRIANVHSLGALTGLTRLWLHDNVIEDIRPLAQLGSLKRLNLERNHIRDVSALRKVTTLQRVRLAGNRIADVGGLVRNTGLGEGDAVGLRGNPLTEASLRDQAPALRAAGAAVLAGWPVHVFPAADDPSGRQGFVRVVNRSNAAGEVLVEAIDDGGVRAAPVRLAIGRRQARHFNSRDLEAGNAAKGLSAGVGAATSGGWRLELSSTLDIEVLAYIRTPDGFLTSIHDLLPEQGFDDHLPAPTFNPARNRRQASALRLVNPAGMAERVNVWGVDDNGRGRLATGLTVPPKAAATVTARALEAPRIGDAGRGLGPGVGKWRLRVHADWPIEAASLLTSPSGHLTNLSSSPAALAADGASRLPLFPAANRPWQGFARVVNRSGCAAVVWITACDDAGECPDPVALFLDAGKTIHFNSEDLQNGASEKGLPTGVGPPTAGDWHLQLRSDLDLRAYAYIRTSDGFLTSMHDVAPAVDGVARVAFFNPASNRRQQSRLRLVNNTAHAVVATIGGFDDAGTAAGAVRVTVPAGQALTYSAEDLEAGAAGLIGALGDGEGKWRLTVKSEAPLAVMSLLASPSGHLTNLSTAPTPLRGP